MDFNAIMNLRRAWDTFRANHPKFPEFLGALKSRGAVEGTEILISVTYPDGQNLKAGIKLKASDTELIEKLSGLF